MKQAIINSTPGIHDPAKPEFQILDDQGVSIGLALYAEEPLGVCPCGCGGKGGSLQEELAGAFRVARQIERDGVTLYADGFARIILTVLRSRNVVLTVAPGPDTPKH